MRAMQSEMKSLQDHNTWRLVDMPPDKKAVGCKWVYRIKRNPSNEIVKFKARLVAKGFTQRPGIDYTETFAPVARKESINVVFGVHQGFAPPKLRPPPYFILFRNLYCSAIIVTSIVYG